MDSKTLIQRIFDECINQGSDAAIDECIAPDFVEHFVTGDIVGRDGFRAFLAQWRAGIPDLRTEVSNVLVSRDMAAWMVRATGTNTGSMMGLPPTGRRVELVVVNMGRIRDGQAVEHWTGNDFAQLLLQLGALNLPAPSAA